MNWCRTESVYEANTNTRPVEGASVKMLNGLVHMGCYGSHNDICVASSFCRINFNILSALPIVIYRINVPREHV